RRDAGAAAARAVPALLRRSQLRGDRRGRRDPAWDGRRDAERGPQAPRLRPGGGSGMGDVTQLIERALDDLAPPRPEPDRWEEIERAALGARSLRRWRFAPLVLTPVAVAAVLAVIALAWPLAAGAHGTPLQR